MLDFNATFACVETSTGNDFVSSTISSVAALFM